MKKIKRKRRKALNIIKRYRKEAIIGFAGGILNGMFGSGAGTVVVFAMERFLKTDAKKTHSSAVLIILIMSLVSACFYVSKGYFDFKLWTGAVIGGGLGGILGAKVLSKIKTKWLKLIFSFFVLWAAYKMIF